ncbi:MAG: FAD-dependent oxidoreductase, partial [Clostridia bacterium]|nr:FAD-dependent oxidoreductase [Clostridia bacterium]
NAVVQKLDGEKVLTGIQINHNGKVKKLKLDGLFVAIGHEPKFDFLDFKIKTDKNGYIIVDKYMQTSVKNVYACGDLVSKHFRQIVTACADGAIAGNSCVGVNE